MRSLLDPAFNSFGSKPRNGITGSYNNPILNFFRKHFAVFHSNYTFCIPSGAFLMEKAPNNRFLLCTDLHPSFTKQVMSQ